MSAYDTIRKQLQKMIKDQERRKAVDSLRPCSVCGSGIFWQGRFHAFVQIGDRAFAIVEDDRGNAVKLNLELFDVRFTDR